MVGKRGRPANTNTTININDLLVEFIYKKENNYNANICYFKVVDGDAKNKNETYSYFRRRRCENAVLEG